MSARAGEVLTGGARWLGALMLVSPQNPASLLEHALLREMLERTLGFNRTQQHSESGAPYAARVTASRDKEALELFIDTNLDAGPQ